MWIIGWFGLHGTKESNNRLVRISARREHTAASVRSVGYDPDLDATNMTSLKVMSYHTTV
ncbi:hypothetical protein PAXRUDRAFT_829943, partial [Paxillus rubicundulus Ve08.2h10]